MKMLVPIVFSVRLSIQCEISVQLSAICDCYDDIPANKVCPKIIEDYFLSRIDLKQSI